MIAAAHPAIRFLFQFAMLPILAHVGKRLRFSINSVYAEAGDTSDDAAGIGLRRRKAARLGRRALQDTGALAAVALAGLKTAATTANGFAGLKTRHYNGEHKWERSLERRVDMEVSRKNDSILGFLGEPRGGEAHF
jgi:hypothetical protein